MNRVTAKYSLFLILIIVLIITSPSPLLAQQGDFQFSGGGHLLVEGETFTFEQISTIVDEEIVFIERAIWEGGVVALLESDYGRVTLETGHIEIIFDGMNVSSLMAGPEVTFTGYYDRAVFECADVFINFPDPESSDPVYSGLCRDVHGYFLAHSNELGLEGDDEIEINFNASRVILAPDSATMESPILSLGNLDKPEFALSAKEIMLALGDHPETGARSILAARIDYLAISCFGNRLNIVPFSLWKKIVKVPTPGFVMGIPSMGYEHGQGIFFDFQPTYNFMLDGLGNTPSIIAHINTFPSDRTYAEIGALVEREEFYSEIWYGYRREETSDGDPVAVLVEPEFTIGHRWIPIYEDNIGLRLSASYGHIHDMTNGPEFDRFRWRANLEHGAVPLGIFSLKWNLDYNDYYYDNDDNYSSLEGRINLRYVDPPRWGTTLYYRRLYQWGSTPFAFDSPKTVNEVGVSEQSRFSRRWGGGFDWSWNIDDDNFERQECHLTYIFDSFQVSLGWDFAGESAQIYFALPGDLK